jgi:hypothetical protein
MLVRTWHARRVRNVCRRSPNMEFSTHAPAERDERSGRPDGPRRHAALAGGRGSSNWYVVFTIFTPPRLKVGVIQCQHSTVFTLGGAGGRKLAA